MVNIHKNVEDDIKELEFEFIDPKIGMQGLKTVYYKNQSQKVEFSKKSGMELFSNFNSQGSTSKNIAVGSGLAAAVGSSVIGFGVAGSLIKLFQVIEILGIFYYIPVTFGPYLSSLMLVLNNLSDLLSLPEELIFKKFPEEKMRSFHKISREELSYNIINSYLLFTSLYSLAILLVFIFRALSYLTGRKMVFLQRKL